MSCPASIAEIHHLSRPCKDDILVVMPWLTLLTQRSVLFRICLFQMWALVHPKVANTRTRSISATTECLTLKQKLKCQNTDYLNHQINPKKINLSRSVDSNSLVYDHLLFHPIHKVLKWQQHWNKCMPSVTMHLWLTVFILSSDICLCMIPTECVCNVLTNVIKFVDMVCILFNLQCEVKRLKCTSKLLGQLRFFFPCCPAVPPVCSAYHVQKLLTCQHFSETTQHTLQLLRVTYHGLPLSFQTNDGIVFWNKLQLLPAQSFPIYIINLLCKLIWL